MRLFPLLFGTRIFTKKFLGLAALLSAVGLSIHFGVSKPRQNNSEVLHLIGSQPLLESNRGNPYEQRFNEAYLVKDFNRNLSFPPLTPALYEKHMHPDTKNQHLHEFNGSMKTYLETEPSSLGNDYTSPLIDRVNRLASLRREYSALSDEEITYKSYLYHRQLRDFEKSHIIQDLMWSLIEESEEKKIVVRPNSIDIDFQLEKIPKDADEHVAKNKFPLDANKVRNFKIRLKVYNPNNELKTIFKSIPLVPYQEVELVIFIDRAEIRPFYTTFQVQGNHNSLKWGLVPVSGSKFHVTQSSIFPFDDSKSFTMDRLSVIYSKSKFIKKVAGRPRIANVPTFQDFSNLVTPYLMAITPDQVKKDLETWYGAAAAFQVHLRARDFKRLTDIMETDMFRDKMGKDHTGLDMLINSSSFRESMYTTIRLSNDVAKVLEQFFSDSPNNAHKITYDEAKWLVKSLSWALQEMANNMQVHLTWKVEPTLSTSMEDDNSPFQAVSFELEQKIIWNKKVTIPFKGCWKKTDNKWEDADSQDACTNDGWFDFSNKLDKLQNLIKPIASLISPMVNKLLPDISKFIGWSKFEIDKDEQIVTTYKAENSPIRPSLSESFDFLEKRSVVPGWKVMDLRTTYDLSKFHRFFYKLYEKIDSYKDTKGVNVTSWTSAIGSVGSLFGGSFSEYPISFAVHMINQLFDPNYFKNSKTPEDQRPWPVFFKTLFANALPIESSQLFVGYSSSMFNVADWVHNSLHDTSSGSKVYKTTKDWQKKDNGNGIRDISDEEWDFPVTFKSRQLKNLMEHYSNMYSNSFPRNPIMFEFQETDEWKSFLQHEGSTSVGFINQRNMVKNILQNMVYGSGTSSSFPSKQSVNWEKVKLSFTQLHLEKALKSVLNLKNQLSIMVDKFLGVPFNNVLGEYIRRDAMMVTVNMMLEDGSASLVKDIIRMLKLSPYSTFSFSVVPNLDKTKLHSSIRKYV